MEGIKRKLRVAVFAVGVVAICAMAFSALLYSLGWWRWRIHTEPVASPSGRFEALGIVEVDPRLRFGVLLRDLETGREEVVGGWTHAYFGSVASEWMRWVGDRDLSVWRQRTNELCWGELRTSMGVDIQWIDSHRPK